MASSSWSNLPLDLLQSIKNELQLHQRHDLTSFRSVCSHWRSAMPAPNPFPRYEVSFNENDKIIQFNMDDNDRGTESSRTIYLSLPSSSSIYFFCSSNGWLVFIIRNNSQILHLFDPVSYNTCIFPPLTPMLLRLYNKFKSTVRNAYRLNLTKVIVSSSANGCIAVAGIVRIRNQIEFDSEENRFVYYRHGDGQKWNLLMEESEGIKDIALAGDGQFYAIGEDWEFYMLDKSTSLMRLKRLKLWLPKQILEPNPKIDRTDKRLSVRWYRMEESGGSDLKIYGCCETFRGDLGSWITLRLEVAKLCGSSNNVSAACEGEWCCLDPTPYGEIPYFTPSLRRKYYVWSSHVALRADSNPSVMRVPQFFRRLSTKRRGNRTDDDGAFTMPFILARPGPSPFKQREKKNETGVVRHSSSQNSLGLSFSALPLSIGERPAVAH